MHRIRRGRYFVAMGAMFVLALLLGTILRNASTADEDRREAGRWYIHTLDVLIVAGDLKAALHQATESESAYLLTGDTRFADRVESGRHDAASFANRFARLTRDNPRQRQNVTIFQPQLARYFAELRQTMALVRAGNGRAAVQSVRSDTVQQRLELSLKTLGRMEREEQQLLEQRRSTMAAAAQRARVIDDSLSAIAGVFLVFAFTAVVAALRSRERLIALSDELHRTATTDALTGLANRRSFEEALALEVEGSARHSTDVCIAIIDLDFFKRINDNFGHQGGDEVLRSVAAVLHDGLRHCDLASRIGGEEFAVLMPNIGLADAKRVCERLRETIERRRIALPNGGTASVTFSVGLACMQARENGDQVIGRADRALYDAKADGRNAVRLAA